MPGKGETSKKRKNGGQSLEAENNSRSTTVYAKKRTKTDRSSLQADYDFIRLDGLVIQEATKQMSTLHWIQLKGVSRQFGVLSKERRNDVKMKLDYTKNNRYFVTCRHEGKEKKKTNGETPAIVVKQQIPYDALSRLCNFAFLSIRKLKKLSVGFSCPARGIQCLLKALQAHRVEKICSLAMKETYYYTMAHWKMITLYAPQLHTLRFSYVGTRYPGRDNKDRWRQMRSTALQSCVSLKKLIVDGCEARLMQEFLDGVKKMTQMTSLKVYGDGPGVGIEPAKKLNEALAQNSQLKRLTVNKFWWPSVTTPAASQLVNQLKFLELDEIQVKSSIQAFPFEDQRAKLLPILTTMAANSTLKLTFRFECISRQQQKTVKSVCKFIDFWLQLADYTTSSIKFRLLPMEVCQEVTQLLQQEPIVTDHLKLHCPGLTLEQPNNLLLVMHFGDGQLMLCQ